MPPTESPRTNDGHAAPRRPRLPRARIAAVAAVTAVVLAASPVPSGGLAAQIPDTFTNLRHFPEDIPRDSLIGIMRQFSFALGVPCRYCHAGGVDDPPWSLEGVDFASDEKIEKRRARYMLRMVERINGELLPRVPGRAESPAGDRVAVECRTCHRGLPRPRMIDRIMEDTIMNAGVAAAVDFYRELRERYYGDWSYDFGQWVMIDLANEMAGRGRPGDAVAILELLLEYYPESTSIWISLGDVQREADMRDDAIDSYRRVLEIAPDHSGALRRLREMDASTTQVPPGPGGGPS